MAVIYICLPASHMIAAPPPGNIEFASGTPFPPPPLCKFHQHHILFFPFILVQRLKLLARDLCMRRSPAIGTELFLTIGALSCRIRARRLLSIINQDSRASLIGTVKFLRIQNGRLTKGNTPPIKHLRRQY